MRWPLLVLPAVLVVVGANHGVTRMTKEHVGMAIALNVPLFVVITKVDLCPEPVMKETIKQLLKLLKLPGARKQPARAQKPSVHSSTPAAQCPAHNSPATS